MKGTGAAVFAIGAALLYALGYFFLPDALSGKEGVADLSVVPAVAAGLFLIAPFLPIAQKPARALMAFWPLVLAPLVASGGEAERMAMIAVAGLWAFGAASLCAGLALLRADPGGELPTLAIFPLGAALAMLLATLLVPMARPLADLLLATPYHFMIFLVVCSTLVALGDAAATGLGQRRERLIRALIGLMPLLGFLGTVAGIIEAMAGLPALFGGGGVDGVALQPVLHGLATAFETTLVGLVGAAACGLLVTVLADRDPT
jgi:hypothetical protein